jgi:hypothetical protein
MGEGSAFITDKFKSYHRLPIHCKRGHGIERQTYEDRLRSRACAGVVQVGLVELERVVRLHPGTSTAHDPLNMPSSGGLKR